jgi:hypothetical protein
VPVHSRLFRSLTFVAGVFALLVAIQLPAQAQCISGSITASFPDDPGYEGLWKYTVELSWDTGAQGLSHSSIFLGLENLECVCNPTIFQFPNPAGLSDGEDCNGGVDPVVYSGEYVCLGDPTIPVGMGKPAVKFDHVDNPECEPGSSGSGTFCFYSPFPPAPFTVDPEGLGVKYGTNTCLGEFSGTPPQGDCSVPAQITTWGLMKATNE